MRPPVELRIKYRLGSDSAEIIRLLTVLSRATKKTVNETAYDMMVIGLDGVSRWAEAQEAARRQRAAETNTETGDTVNEHESDAEGESEEGKQEAAAEGGTTGSQDQDVQDTDGTREAASDGASIQDADAR